MQVLTAKEMTAADRRTVEMGTPIAVLMERAGDAVARFCLGHFVTPDTRRIVVLCGKGNNGGDGLVAARRLATAGPDGRHDGIKVLALLLGGGAMQGDAAAAALEAARASVEIVEVDAEEQLRTALAEANLILDAVVGTGFEPPLRGWAEAARQMLVATSAPVIAIDLPSGWDADSTWEKAQGAFRADAVVTFARPKMAHVFGHLTPGKTFGAVVLADIGTPERAIQSETQLSWCGAAKTIAEQARGVNGNKGRMGHVLVVGGAWGKAGAPAMASLAGMRTGAGLVTAAVPARIVPLVASIAPELMLQELGEHAQPGPELLGKEQLERMLKGISVVGIGPGMGQEGTTPEFVRGFVERVTLPMVIDADALNALAGRTGLLKRAAAMKDVQGNPRTIVLTPHPGEMARLAGMSVKEVEADRIGLARRFAAEHGVTLVLKGWRTLVAHPDGRIGVNTTGNPSMAKGGSGDILTGMVCAMLAQYPEDTARAVEAAVFLHGLAGDFACLAQDEHTVLATDTVAHLWQAFRARATDADGFTWLSGTATNGAGR